ncbi:ionotropic receptor 93a-like [Macrobrachium nipponense]|uniref:ionotropic receptor 93a-like n=1 Tax=Macrobrachium nipponense TaxID=159736 RepID=UPI0030C832AD
MTHKVDFNMKVGPVRYNTEQKATLHRLWQYHRLSEYHSGASWYLEAVMSVVPYSVSLERTKAVDFSEPVYIDELTIAYHKYQLQSDMAGFIKPFTLITWLCIFGSLLIITPAMIFLRLYQHDDSGNPNARKITLGSTVWPLCCLIDQSSIWEPQHDPSRVAGCFWELMGFILSCVYRSTLMAMLITPKVELPFNSLEELAKSDIPIWAPIGSRFQDGVKGALKGEKLAAIGKNMIYSNDTMGAVAAFKVGKWGYATAKRTLVYYLHEDFTKHGHCTQYIMADGVFKPTPLSLAFPKGSTFKPTVDRIIRNLKEFGIVEYLYKQRAVNATSCLSPLSSGFADEARPLALYNFYGVFSVYMGGMILGTVAFLVEILTRTNFSWNL